MSRRQPLIAEAAALAAQFAAHFPPGIAGLRTIGREAEYPVVTATGQAADVRRLWPVLQAGDDLQPAFDDGRPDLVVKLSGADYSYALEVGLGTVEINTRPCRDLFTLQAIQEMAMARLVEAAAFLGWRVLAYGIQPATLPHAGLLAPKQRYQVLYQVMGAGWLWYTVTASDQLQIDLCRPELVQMLNFGNLMAPVLVALCGNSPVYGGSLSPHCSAREAHMGRIYAHEHRHGMPARPYTNLIDFVQTVSRSTCLMLRENGHFLPGGRPFTDYLARHGPDFPAFLFHEHYVWNSARLRASYGTLELRPACQQPWSEHMAAAALALGLVEAAGPILDYVDGVLGTGAWPAMRNYLQQAITAGLAATAPAPGFLERIVTLAAAGLQRRGQGEERLLLPIFERLRRRQNPAQVGRRVFEQAGLAGLIARAAISPYQTSIRLNDSA